MGNVRKDEVLAHILRQLHAEGMADARGLVDGGEVGHGGRAGRNRSLPAEDGAPASSLRPLASAKGVSLEGGAMLHPGVKLPSRNGSSRWSECPATAVEMFRYAISGISIKRVFTWHSPILHFATRFSFPLVELSGKNSSKYNDAEY